MITFTFLSGKQIEFDISKKYKGFCCKYFYHIKAYVLDETQYCYRDLTYNTKKIKDIELEVYFKLAYFQAYGILRYFLKILNRFLIDQLSIEQTGSRIFRS